MAFAPSSFAQSADEFPPDDETMYGAGLDNIPEQYLENLELDPGTLPGAGTLTQGMPDFASRVYLPNLEWKVSEVSAALYGGTNETYSLIESAAQEWTQYAKGKFRFNFRNLDNSFRQWVPDDVRPKGTPLATSPAADLRIRVDDNSGGYWAATGRTALNTKAYSPGAATMNLGGFVRKLAAFYKDKNGTRSLDKNAWLHSYYHSTALHELGHALGLAHEQFHGSCQSDLKLDPDHGYMPKKTKLGANSVRYEQDDDDRSPGAILYMRGLNNWSDKQARAQVVASEYFQKSTAKVLQSPAIDQTSVMLYWFPPYVFRSGTKSPCTNLGDGGKSKGYRFATHLSPNDIQYFQQKYGGAP